MEQQDDNKKTWKQWFKTPDFYKVNINTFDEQRILLKLAKLLLAFFSVEKGFFSNIAFVCGQDIESCKHSSLLIPTATHPHFDTGRDPHWRLDM